MDATMGWLFEFLALAAAITAFISLRKVNRLTHDVDGLKRQLSAREATRAAAATSTPAPTMPNSDDISFTDTSKAPAPHVDVADIDDAQDDVQDSENWIERKVTTTPYTAEPNANEPALPGFVSRVKDNWMAWLGGISVALSGIFLAQYSIEAGMLGPIGRISLGLGTGFALHAAAEWFRRQHGQPHVAFAALAGGGSITLFAALVASLQYYALLSPMLSFFLLALVALGTMALALRHGPIVAALGIIGAYLVPAMVSTDEGNILVALAYSLIICASALLLLRYVYRTWLWWGMVAGALLWWLIALFDSNAAGFHGYYLGAFAYVLLALPDFNWTLNKRVNLGDGSYGLAPFHQILTAVERQLPLTGLLVILAQCLSIYAASDLANLNQWVWLVVVLLISSRFRETLYPLPWIALVGQCIAWLLTTVERQADAFIIRPVEDANVLWYLLGTGVIYTALGLRNFGRCRFAAVWASLALVAPVLLFVTAYLLTGNLISEAAWRITALLAGLAYLALATLGRRRRSADTLVVWLFFAGHFALSLAAVFSLDSTGLTVALALQIVSIAWIIRTFALPDLGWLLKLMVMLVITRLTFNPWLLDYPIDSHWTLWTYGGATLCALGSYWLLRGFDDAFSDGFNALKAWTEGASLHLFVLTCWTELRYWLYDGDVFFSDFTLLEAALYVNFFAIMSIVYYQRGRRSLSLQRIYSLIAFILLGLSTVSYLCIAFATLASLRWLTRDVGTTLVFNILLLAYGAPALAAWLVSKFHWHRLRRPGLLLAGVMAFGFVSLEIRHLWQSNVNLSLPTGSAELYTYSIVWLLIAVSTMLAGSWRLGANCYRAGLGILMLVILKIFLVDMGDLEGLLRVASFMGLGLGMLGVSFLHQKLQQPNSENV
ncbi:MAG: putative membrane protein [Candidatus Azotimanducaceae bacterium]|jgi:uncharacterized membrane protein